MSGSALLRRDLRKGLKEGKEVGQDICGRNIRDRDAGEAPTGLVRQFDSVGLSWDPKLLSTSQLLLLIWPRCENHGAGAQALGQGFPWMAVQHPIGHHGRVRHGSVRRL